MNVAGARHCLFKYATVAAVVLLLPQAAMAKKDKRDKKSGSPEAANACVDKYKTGLDNEQAGHLKQARELFIGCAKASCGSPLRDECTTRFTQLSTDIPSVVPVVTDEAGNPQTDVEVRVDGERLTSSLDGHSFLLDPGVREFSFSREGRVFATQRLMIVQGQRNRLLSVSSQPAAEATTKRPTKIKKPAASIAVAAATEVAPPAPPPPGEPVEPKVAPHESVDLQPHPKAEQKSDEPQLNLAAEESESSGTPKLTYALTATGVAALGAGAMLIYWGRNDNDKLAACSSSTTNCRQSTVDHIHNLYLGGNIALGVGVASLAGAYWAYAHHSAKEAESHEAYRFDVQPTKSGAVASIGGSF
jgi:hypothetical protein